MGDFAQDGYVHLPFERAVADWAKAAHQAALDVVKRPGDMRHGATWRVGLKEVPNAADGSIDGMPLSGAWTTQVDQPATWHRAQLSVVYPGYPQQDPAESDANHRYRLSRDAAHVDGLLPIGPDKRRFLREPHAFILGLPLNLASGSPLVVWPGSHLIMQSAIAAAYKGAGDLSVVDVTEIYQAARKDVFAQCPRVELRAAPGEATLLHRHLLHGVAPWQDEVGPPEGRMIAYFRPELAEPRDWL